MENITASQTRIISMLLKERLKEKAHINAFIASFTEDPEQDSISDLNTYQADDLIYFLRNGKNACYASWARFNNRNRHHRYILSLCRGLGWTRYDDKSQKTTVDLSQFGDWLHQHGYLHKRLKDYSTKELPVLILQLEQLLKNKP